MYAQGNVYACMRVYACACARVYVCVLLADLLGGRVYCKVNSSNNRVGEKERTTQHNTRTTQHGAKALRGQSMCDVAQLCQLRKTRKLCNARAESARWRCYVVT